MVETLIYSDPFGLILGLAQIILAVFGIFVLGLLIKIFSDISEITDRTKNELNKTLTDFFSIRAEAKQTAGALIKTIALIISTAGIKKIATILNGLARTPAKPKKKSSPRAKRVTVKSE